MPASSPVDDLIPLLREHGANTLGWMQTWEGNQVWVSPFDEAGVAYRGAGGVALTVTDLAYEEGTASRAIAEMCIRDSHFTVQTSPAITTDVPREDA